MSKRQNLGISKKGAIISGPLSGTNCSNRWLFMGTIST